ncbi:unnamed protein product [Rotaria socialis]|uniref:DUF3533 domain-containing protein n=1 Tax=Rotaria socialis TaxID=392032 RepID=A0A820TFN0_9BILA|nr:unnamed protein product [Rotaria socialis]
MFVADQSQSSLPHLWSSGAGSFASLSQDPYSRTRSLDVYVIDLDHDTAGSYFLTAFHQTPPGNLTLNWIFKQPSEFPSGFADKVENGKAWAVVYMHSNITARVNQIIESILYGYSYNSISYIPSSAVNIVYDEGRNPNTVDGFTLPPIQIAIATASANYAAYIQARIDSYSNATFNTVMMAVSLSQIISSPIGFTNVNLHPASSYARSLATGLGYLFLWLIMTALVTVNIRITTPLVKKIKLIDIAIIRILSAIFNSLIISLIYSLCVLWFGNFTDAIPFIRFWLFNWLAAYTFVSIIALFSLNLGVMAHIVLILFLILNFSTAGSSLAIELQYTFYRIGYGLPLFHCLSAGRHLLFGSHTRFGVDVGTLIVYCTICILLTIITSAIRMHKQQKLITKNKHEEIFKKKKTINKAWAR